MPYMRVFVYVCTSNFVPKPILTYPGCTLNSGIWWYIELKSFEFHLYSTTACGGHRSYDVDSYVGPPTFQHGTLKYWNELGDETVSVSVCVHFCVCVRLYTWCKV